MSFQRQIHGAFLRMRQGEVLEILSHMEKAERHSSDELRAAQSNRLSAVLQHAGTHIPYYRKVFEKAGVDPGARIDPATLSTLPVLTKDLIRENGIDLLSPDAAARGATRNATGGSTGAPMEFHQDNLYRLHRQAAMYRGFRLCGWPVGGSLAYLWGSDIDSRAHMGLGAIKDKLLGITWFDAFRLDESDLDRILDRLAAADPDILIGYTTTVHHVARRALSRGGGPKLKSVETSAEMLTPEVRSEIEAAFGCKVYDRYGCREAGVVSHECEESNGWHINTETVFVETDADGHLLLTTLLNYSMPLIRYRNEDLVELSDRSCSCGRNLPLMTKIVGRKSDIIFSPSGKAIHGEFFTHLFYGQPGVREFQVCQKSLENLLVRVVAGPEFTPGHRQAIDDAILQHGDAAFRIKWESLAAIPRSASGKLRFTISEIESPDVNKIGNTG
jgi:phenylacetate-CoA ligase